MGLSRLDNFLKSVRGTILYVNPNDLDATDSIENKGNSLTRPFKTIQRALIESARFSYQRGLNNDRFAKTTILLYPGEHLVDNRPGFIPDGINNYRLRNGSTTNDLPAFDLTSNFDLSTADNELYKLNSIHGGVIIPRGTSIVGLDLRKTKVRPKYVPDPVNDSIERSCLFRVTGACYLWQFSMFDADPNGQAYKDYTDNLFVPNFSHHKLSCFEYADGVNPVVINDDFQSYSSSRTDLEMYYEKISLVYGQSSGRAIEPDYPSTGLDIQPKIDEYRIVGSTGQSVGITSIRAGDGVTATTDITVTTSASVAGLDVDTPFRVEGISASGYSGQFVVAEKLNATQIKYQVQNAPTNALPSVAGASLALSSDTVTSASPYMFNLSLRSVFGMCGLIADGSKATGFRSMVVAQFTGIGLQKDDRAFVKYNESTPPTGQYDDNTVSGNETLSNNSKAIYKPGFRNFHIKITNKSFIQAVSIFAIGYADHFVTESGGDLSLTNSNSNFGANALASSGFRDTAFAQDDFGYITHVIPPKEVPLTETAVEFESIDVVKTDSVAGVGSTGHLYLYGRTNADVPPENVIDGYRVGAKVNDTLGVLVSSGGSVTEYTARIVMPGSQTSSEKIFTVDRSAAGINSIGSFSSGGTSNVITLTEEHTFLEGESVRVLSDTGQIPDGLTHNTVFFAIPVSGQAKNIKLAKTQNDALNGTALTINEKGGVLKVVSRVSDKNAGDIGHPVQYDTTNTQWYVKVGTAATDNSIYSTIVSLGSTELGAATPRTFIKRKNDSRSSNDTTYRIRYVIPSSTGGGVARPPSDGFILQESNTSIGSTDAEVQTYFGSGSLANENQQRNFRFIAGARWDGSNIHYDTEAPHDLTVGSQVEVLNVKSTVNLTGIANSSFNRLFTVTGISSAKNFTVGFTTDPGTFSNDTSSRTTTLPYFRRKRYDTNYYVYRNNEVQPYISGEQDGIYYLTIVNASNSPTVSPFTQEKFSQPVQDLFPQTNRDNPTSDPEAARCFASSSLIGQVFTNNPENSITRETIQKYHNDSQIGVGITNITSATGTAHTITTTIDHGLNRITNVSIANSGAGYGSGTAGDIYNARLVSIGSSITGKNATAKITVDGAGGITAVKIMDGGSAYGIGNTMAVVGVATTTGYSQAVIQVDQIYDNVGDVLRIVGVRSESFSGYNDLYRITGVGTAGVGTDRERTVTVQSATTNSGFTTSGTLSAAGSEAYFYLTGESIRVSSLAYDLTSGIATVTTSNFHGQKVDRKIRITGADQAQYNGSFVINEIVGTSGNSFAINVGVGTTAPTATGTIFAFPEGYGSNDGVLTVDNENLNGRMVPTYAGITTVLSGAVPNATTEDINVLNPATLDINIGDYLMIDDEMVRVKTTTNAGSAPAVMANPIKVFRGILGTRATTHSADAVVRRIHVAATELRRHSIIRASGHTFEYVGYGPGNYSTAFPDKQDRRISFDEELLAQSIKKEGGVNFYTGMNDQGISYAGNKKLSTITGREEIFETPIQTITGEDISGIPGLNVTEATEASFARSIRVEGGDDNKTSSEFNGPVIVNNKLTVSSTKGLEANNLFIQGDATVSRKYTVGIATPSLAGNPGDIEYFSNPSEGGYVGWVYTVENNWRRFGNVSLSRDLNIGLFDAVGIATTSPGLNKLQVGSGTSLFAVDSDGVGIGTTANSFAFRVVGESTFGGSVVATAFTGDGSGLTNLNTSNSGWTNYSTGTGGIYNTKLNSVGIGTSLPEFELTVGSVGIASTTLGVHGEARFFGLISGHDANISGMITTSDFDLQSSSGQITAGIITSTNIRVGSSATTLMTSGTDVGIGTATPRAKLDIEGHTRFKTYSEVTDATSISSNVVILDLSKAQTFTLTADAAVNSFTLSNIPSGATSFTIKIVQDSSTAYGVGIDTFKNSSGTAIPVYWPGGVIPYVTRSTSAVDVYSFKLFDGDNATSSGLYGVVGGQNFS